jgi:GNAT superfamily N-acetyltransferase
VELASLAQHELGAGLTARGYRLVSFENVLGRPLDPVGPAPAPPTRLTVDEVGEDLDTWLSVMVEASVVADDRGLESHEEFPADALRAAEAQLLKSGARPYLVRLDGEIVGGGSFRVAGRVAQLGGAATLPAHRRRGVQSALIAHRLHAAAAAGCDVATVTTQPGSTSQQNVQRAGFELLYVRAVLLQDGVS